jgi:hypothetical protein
MDPATKPSVLFIYFTYTNQTRKVIDAALAAYDQHLGLGTARRRP